MEIRKIPRALFEPLEEIVAAELTDNEAFINLIKKETIPAIQAAFKNRKTFATLFEVNRTGYYIDIPKQYWITALEECINFLLEDEKFEECVEIKKLIDDIRKPVRVVNKKNKKKVDGEQL